MEASNSSTKDVRSTDGFPLKFMWFSISVWVSLFLINVFENSEITETITTLIGNPILAGKIGIGTTVVACVSCLYFVYSAKIGNFKGFSRGIGLFVLLGPAGVYLTYEAPRIFLQINLLILFVLALTVVWLGNKLGQNSANK